jgi:hypothetical protein
MVVQVGDKVLVYGAGTPWSFAKTIAPLEVGDTVDVVTLSDGTKLAMPKIELDLSEYVWVVPEFDTPFNIGDVPFQWGMMPLGAAVFTVTGIACHTITDSYREWEADELSGCLLMDLTQKQQLEITGNDETTYQIKPANDPPAPIDPEFNNPGAWLTYAGFPSDTIKIEDSALHVKRIYGSSTVQSYASMHVNLAQVYRCVVRWRGWWSGPWWARGGMVFRILLDGGILADGAWNSRLPYEVNPIDGIYYSPSWPEYDVIDAVCLTSSANATLQCLIKSKYANEAHFYLDSVRFYDIDGNEIREPCHPAKTGDKYVIYNPTTKRLIFCDSGKLITDANWVTGGTGAEISSSPVEYVWDGQGHVYLSSSKLTNSTIQFDDLLQVQAVHGETTRTIAFHLGERIAQGGETVSRELTNITSILRSGKNTITLTAKNQDGTKVGFVTAVYVKRNMTAVSL